MVTDYAIRSDVVLANIPPPKDLEQFWQLFLMWSNNFERSRAEEVRTISDSVTRLVTGAQSLDARIDKLESLADQLLPRVPNMVDAHERAIQELRNWQIEVDTPPGILHRLTTQDDQLEAISSWRAREVAIVAAVSSTVVVLGGIGAALLNLIHLGGHP